MSNSFNSDIPPSPHTSTTTHQPLIESIVHITAPISSKLSDSNYLSWKSQILLMLHDASPDPTARNSASQEILNPAYSAWRRQDKLLNASICSTLSDSILAHVMSSSTSRDLWLALQHCFTNTSKAKLLVLKSQLQNITKGESSCSDYLLLDKQLVDELAFLGYSLLEDDLVSHAVNGLGPEFSGIKDSFLIIRCHSTFTLSDLRGLLLSHEALSITKDQPNATAFYTDWMGIRSFCMDSPYALLTEALSLPKRIPRPGNNANHFIQLTGTCSITNAKTGIWISEDTVLQMVCPGIDADEQVMLSAENKIQFPDIHSEEKSLDKASFSPSVAHDKSARQEVEIKKSACCEELRTETKHDPLEENSDLLLDVESKKDLQFVPLVLTSVRRLINVPHSHDDLYPTFPWISRHRSSPYDDVNLHFYSVAFSKVFQVSCPETLGMFLGSKGGYFLCKTDELHFNPMGAPLSLLNPLLRDEIMLPSYNTWDYGHMHTSGSQLSDFVVMFSTLDRRIATIPLNALSQQAWDEFELGDDCADCRQFCLRGILFSEHQESGGTVVTELNTGNHVCSIPVAENFISEEGSVYILEASGSILRVVGNVQTMRWMVYQLDYSSGTWARTYNIGNIGLFIDMEGGFALRASQAAGIKANYIYFLGPGSDVLLVHIGDGHVKTVPYPWELGHWFSPNIQSLPR